MNLGMSEMIFIFLLALLIFGPRKLPEIARQVGKFMGEFKRAGNEFRAQIENEIQQIELEEQIKKDAEKREAAMREIEQRRQEERAKAEAQGELFEEPKPAIDPMPSILPPEGTIVNETATPRSSLAQEHAPVIEEHEHTEPNA